MREYYTKETVFENSPAIVCIEYNGFFFFFLIYTSVYGAVFQFNFVLYVLRQVAKTNLPRADNHRIRNILFVDRRSNTNNFYN